MLSLKSLKHLKQPKIRCLLRDFSTQCGMQRMLRDFHFVCFLSIHAYMKQLFKTEMMADLD